jgi:hypothetical protein
LAGGNDPQHQDQQLNPQFDVHDKSSMTVGRWFYRQR